MRFPPVFSKSDRRGLLLLEWMAILALVLLWAYSNRKPESGNGGGSFSTDSLSQRKTSRNYTYAVPEMPVESFPFDPNTADSTTLLRLGLAPWQVKAIYNYRAKHGRYHTAEDFKRLPGMTLELWERLGKFVTIDKKYRYLDVPPVSRPRSSVPSVQENEAQTETTHPQTKTSDSIKQLDENPFPIDTTRYPVKFEEKTLVDINTADTNLLKKIPNIGSYRAREIVNYRQRLGGYTEVNQVMEACEMPDEVLDWFSLVPVPVKTLNVNSLSVRQLMRHPYLSFYQAREIVAYRKEHGPIKQIEELATLDKFSSFDIERLRPYLVFQ